jgi:hypothetical protein
MWFAGRDKQPGRGTEQGPPALQPRDWSMTASLETLTIAAYVFADSLAIPRTGPQGTITDKELIVLAVAQAVTGLNSDRQFLGASAGSWPAS